MLVGRPRKRKVVNQEDNEEPPGPKYIKAKTKSPKFVKLFDLTGNKFSLQQMMKDAGLDDQHYQITYGNEDGKIHDWGNLLEQLYIGSPVRGTVENGRSKFIKTWEIDQRGIYSVMFTTHTDFVNLDTWNATTPQNYPFHDYNVEFIPLTETIGLGHFNKHFNVLEGDIPVFEVLSAKIKIIDKMHCLPQANANALENIGNQRRFTDNKYTAFQSSWVCTTPPESDDFQDMVNTWLNPHAYNRETKAGIDEWYVNVLRENDFDKVNQLYLAGLDNETFSPPEATYKIQGLSAAAKVFSMRSTYRLETNQWKESSGAVQGPMNHHFSEHTEEYPGAMEFEVDFTHGGSTPGLYAWEDVVIWYNRMFRQPGVPARGHNVGPPPDVGDFTTWHAILRATHDPIAIVELLVMGNGFTPESYTMISGRSGDTGFTWSDNYKMQDTYFDMPAHEDGNQYTNGYADVRSQKSKKGQSNSTTVPKVAMSMVECCDQKAIFHNNQHGELPHMQPSTKMCKITADKNIAPKHPDCDYPSIAKNMVDNYVKHIHIMANKAKDDRLNMGIREQCAKDAWNMMSKLNGKYRHVKDFQDLFEKDFEKLKTLRCCAIKHTNMFNKHVKKVMIQHAVKEQNTKDMLTQLKALETFKEIRPGYHVIEPVEDDRESTAHTDVVSNPGSPLPVGPLVDERED